MIFRLYQSSNINPSNPLRFFYIISKHSCHLAFTKPMTSHLGYLLPFHIGILIKNDIQILAYYELDGWNIISRCSLCYRPVKEYQKKQKQTSQNTLGTSVENFAPSGRKIICLRQKARSARLLPLALSRLRRSMSVIIHINLVLGKDYSRW